MKQMCVEAIQSKMHTKKGRRSTYLITGVFCLAMMYTACDIFSFVMDGFFFEKILPFYKAMIWIGAIGGFFLGKECFPDEKEEAENLLSFCVNNFLFLVLSVASVLALSFV